MAFPPSLSPDRRGVFLGKRPFGRSRARALLDYDACAKRNPCPGLLISQQQELELSQMRLPVAGGSALVSKSSRLSQPGAVAFLLACSRPPMPSGATAKTRRDRERPGHRGRLRTQPSRSGQPAQYPETLPLRAHEGRPDIHGTGRCRPTQQGDGHPGGGLREGQTFFLVRENGKDVSLGGAHALTTGLIPSDPHARPTRENSGSGQSPIRRRHQRGEFASVTKALGDTPRCRRYSRFPGLGNRAESKPPGRKGIMV